MIEIKRSQNFDPWLLGAVFILIAVSILMVFSTTAILSKEFYGDSTAMVKRHLFSVILGFLAFVAATKINPKVLKHIALPGLIITILMLALVLSPSIGRTAGGAQRWVSLGFIKLQPGELAKIFMVIYFSTYIESHWSRMHGLLEGALVPFSIIGLVGSLLLLEPDFGTTAVIGIVVLGQLFIAARLSHLVSFGLVGVMSALILVLQSPYRMKRLLAFMDPFAAADTSGYQLIQSLIAVGSGGVWGEGLGAGKQKLYYLPAAHTDFIFAVISEELGLIGALFVLSLFLVILYRGIVIAKRLSYDPFLCSLTVGSTLMIVVPALLNVGVVTGMLPTKGMVLPLVAYGSTAMIVHLGVMGLLFKLSAVPAAEQEVVVKRVRYPMAKQKRHALYS